MKYKMLTFVWLFLFCSTIKIQASDSLKTFQFEGYTLNLTSSWEMDLLDDSSLIKTYHLTNKKIDNGPEIIVKEHIYHLYASLNNEPYLRTIKKTFKKTLNQFLILEHVRFKNDHHRLSFTTKSGNMDHYYFQDYHFFNLNNTTKKLILITYYWSEKTEVEYWGKPDPSSQYKEEALITLESFKVP